MKTLAVAAVILLAALVLYLPLFEAPALPQDEGLLLVYPELITKGKVPYRDFEAFYGPGNIDFLAGVYSLFGPSLSTERLVGLFYRLAILAGVFYFGRRWGLLPAALATILAALFSFMMSLIALAWFGAVAALIWALCIIETPAVRPWRPLGAGLLAGLAVLYRQDLAVAALVAPAPLLLSQSPRNRWWFVAGFAAGLLPYAGYAAAAGLRPLMDNVFVYPVLICSPGRKLPLTFASPGAAGIVLLHVIACAVNLLAAVRRVRFAPDSSRNRLVLSMAILAAALTPQALQRADQPHVSMAIFLSLALMPITIRTLVPEKLDVRWAGALSGGVAVIAVTLGGWIYPAARNSVRNALSQSLSSDLREPLTVEIRDRSIIYGSHSNPPPRRLLKHLERLSRPGERLFVGGGDLRRAFSTHTWIYHLYPWLEPASYFLEMNPMSANRPDSRLAGDIATAHWLILDSRWDHPNEPNRSAHEGSDLPNQIVRERFEPVTSYRSYSLYRRKPANVAGVIPTQASSRVLKTSPSTAR